MKKKDIRIIFHFITVQYFTMVIHIFLGPREVNTEILRVLLIVSLYHSLHALHLSAVTTDYVTTAGTLRRILPSIFRPTTNDNLLFDEFL